MFGRSRHDSVLRFSRRQSEIGSATSVHRDGLEMLARRQSTQLGYKNCIGHLTANLMTTYEASIFYLTEAFTLGAHQGADWLHCACMFIVDACYSVADESIQA